MRLLHGLRRAVVQKRDRRKREFVHQQGRVAGAPVGRRGVGAVIEKGAEDAGGLVKRRRLAQHAAAVVVAVGLLLADHTGVVPLNRPRMQLPRLKPVH